jgi:hypothetical protein
MLSYVCYGFTALKSITTEPTRTTPAAKSEDRSGLSRWIRAPRRIRCIPAPQAKCDHISPHPPGRSPRPTAHDRGDGPGLIGVADGTHLLERRAGTYQVPAMMVLRSFPAGAGTCACRGARARCDASYRGVFGLPGEFRASGSPKSSREPKYSRVKLAIWNT